MERDYLHLFELQQQMRGGIEEIFPGKIWVCAEVASVQVKANGHCYMDLSQSIGGKVVAKAKAVIWRSHYAPISIYYREVTGEDIKPGVELLVRVLVTYSEIYGLTLTIDEVEPRYTLGAAELARRQSIERLEKEGLMDRQKQLVPARLPYRLAVITARDAAGFGDFKRHLSENEYGFVFELDLFEATMQGETAPESITDAIACVESAACGYDAVLILRGGGSALDLACFDDYGLCFAIANCGIPVYTAIGHDKDYHVADMVAYDFGKTPTALADRFIDALAAEDELISSFSTRLRLAFVSKLSEMSSRVELLAARIKAADPRNILSRGYTLVTDSSGVVLKSSAGLKAGDRVSLLFEDGCVNAIIED